MKAKYVKPELSVVDFEINSAISACATAEGVFAVNVCELPGDMYGENPFLEGTSSCTSPVKVKCKHTSMTMNFDS